jgi:galactokinase
MLKTRVTERFYELYSKKPILVKAPGRINLIGEHTDYNEGLVFPAAIDRYITFAIAPNGTANQCRLYAYDLEDSFNFDLSNFQPLNKGWQNYLMGVVSELQQLGKRLQGFDCVFSGNIPSGGGLSSSAALECGLAFGLNYLFQLGLSKFQLAKAAQLAEHHFMGVKCGIMDQFASMMVKKDHAIQLDCRSLEYSYFKLDLGDYRLLLCDSNIKHELASSEYNTRRLECDTGVAILKKHFTEISSLRDVNINMLNAHKSDFPEIIFNRCKYVIEENQRVLDCGKAMLENDLEKVGKLLFEGHAGLRDLYEVSCKELDFLVELAQKTNYILGARMMGGGFGGCTINLIHRSKVDYFKDHAKRQYDFRFGKKLSTFSVKCSDGASLID